MNNIKKNSRKGFTLVELVVVIAILAILAAIAIPVVSSTIESSQRSSALSNAQSIELALKEAHAMLAANDHSVYENDATVEDVYTEKSLTVENEVLIGGVTYNLVIGTDEKVYYATVASALDLPDTFDADFVSVAGSTPVTPNETDGISIFSDSDTEVIDLF